MAMIKKISELEQLKTLSDSSNVIIEEDGVAKRIPAREIGGAPKVKRYYYTSLSAAVADLNAETTENADATAETAACSLYTDSDNEQVLELLADIELVESLTITVNSRFNLNGHLISYNGDYSLNFEGEQCVLDGSVAGSKLYKQSAKTTSSSQLVFMRSGEIAGVTFELNVDEIGGSQDCITVQNGKVVVKECAVTANCKYTGSTVKYEVYGINAKDNADLTVANTTINLDTEGMIVNGAIRSNQKAGNVEIVDSSVTITGGNCGAYGPYGIYLTGHAEQSVIKNTEVYANRVDSGGSAILIVNCKKSILDKVKAIGNFPSEKGVGIRFQNTDAYVTNSVVYAANSGINPATGSNAYISNCIIFGYYHSLYCASGEGCHAYVNDCTIRCKDAENIPNCGESTAPTSCVYVGEGSGTGNTLYMDNCTLTSAAKDEAIDWAVVVRSNANTPTTANLSNCIIDTGLAKPIRIEDGANDNQLAAVNIGFNTVDADGNPITKDYAVDEDVDGVADANADFLYVTGLLYRRLPDNVQATGRDYEAYYSYLMHLADKEV